MPQIVLAATANAALTAPAVAATVAPAVAATGTAAAQTAALELAKQKAIQAGTQQLGQQAAQQATQQVGQQVAQQATQQATQQAAQQGLAQASQQATQQLGQQALAQTGQEAAVEAAKQGGVEAMKQGIFSNPAGVPPTAGAPITPAGPAQPLPPAGGTPFTPPTMANTPPVNPNSMEYLKQQYPEAFKTAAQNAPQTGGAAQALPKIAPEDLISKSVADAQAASKQIADVGTSFYDKPVVPEGIGFKPPPSTNPLKEGIQAGLEFMDKHPVPTGLSLMSAGQYMNKPEEEDKDKYKNTVDMSEFQPSIAQQRPFTRSYEYQSYAVGGPVEQMAAMNAVGMNTGYPMAGINTPVYSNPMMQRPEATNVIAPSADAGVGAFSGEPRYAEGGLSAAERREYGLKTRSQRAAQNLTKTFEEMEEERQKEAMKLFGERFDPGIIRRSRTQELSSPFSAAMAEHARLGKKTKVPVMEMPKTNLGDIDTYMDIPIEAAQGGIMHGLGGYSDGGRLLKGPGDGVSDSIPAVIGKRQPARLADGEFVIPARIVSELGNGSTEAGARKLYAMMERVQNARKKSIGKKKVAVNSKADKHLPA